jgi:hypothetical protein
MVVFYASFVRKSLRARSQTAVAAGVTDWRTASSSWPATLSSQCPAPRRKPTVREQQEERSDEHEQRRLDGAHGRCKDVHSGMRRREVYDRIEDEISAGRRPEGEDDRPTRFPGRRSTISRPTSRYVVAIAPTSAVCRGLSCPVA